MSIAGQPIRNIGINYIFEHMMALSMIVIRFHLWRSFHSLRIYLYRQRIPLLIERIGKTYAIQCQGKAMCVLETQVQIILGIFFMLNSLVMDLCFMYIRALVEIHFLCLTLSWSHPSSWIMSKKYKSIHDTEGIRPPLSWW